MANFKKIMAGILSVVTLAGSCLAMPASAAEVAVENSGVSSNFTWNSVSKRNLVVTGWSYAECTEYKKAKSVYNTAVKNKKNPKVSAVVKSDRFKCYAGDIDGDGKLTPNDVDIYIDVLNGKSNYGLTVFGGIGGAVSPVTNFKPSSACQLDPRWDVNRDGKANKSDALMIAGYIANRGNYYYPGGCWLGKEVHSQMKGLVVKSGSKTLYSTSGIMEQYVVKGGKAGVSYGKYKNASKFADAYDY